MNWFFVRGQCVPKISKEIITTLPKSAHDNTIPAPHPFFQAKSRAKLFSLLNCVPVRDCEAVWLHGVALPVVEVAHARVEEVDDIVAPRRPGHRHRWRRRTR